MKAIIKKRAIVDENYISEKCYIAELSNTFFWQYVHPDLLILPMKNFKIGSDFYSTPLDFEGCQDGY